MITNVTAAATTTRSWSSTSPQPATGHESRSDARDNGWLGQVPPASTPDEAPRTVVPNPPTSYANPQLAPEPWKSDAPLWLDDPTLFG